MLDKKDKKIIYELDRDARQPLSHIAKKVGLSRESILYRIRKYLAAGIIRDYLTIVDMSRLGFTTYKIFTNLQNITEKEEKSFVDYLCKLPNVLWVSSSDGRYSLVYAVMARSVKELSGIMRDIENRFWKFIAYADISAIIHGRHFYRDYLLGIDSSTEKVIEWGGGTAHFMLDEVDVGILESLSKDSRASSVSIAKGLHISPDAVIARIRKLERTGVIRHYMVWPDVSRLKGIYYKVLVRLHKMNDEVEKKLYAYSLHIPNIVYIVNALGSWQFEMDMEVENVKEFRSIMRDFLRNFSGNISFYTSVVIYEEHKYCFFDKRLFLKALTP